MPVLEKNPEDQDWDIAFSCEQDRFGHVGASWLAWDAIKESEFRWAEYDPVYEKMWKDMAGTMDRQAQEEKIRELVKYGYNRSLNAYIYSPLTLYAVNKEVDFVPQKGLWLRLKETSVSGNHWSMRGRK